MRLGHKARGKRENWQLFIISIVLAIIFVAMFCIFVADVNAAQQDKSPQISAWAPVYGAVEKVVFNTTKNSGLVARVYLDPTNKHGAGLVVSVFYGNGSEEPIFKFWGLNTSKEQMAFTKENIWISERGLATQLYMKSPHLTLVGVKMTNQSLTDIDTLKIQVLNNKGKVSGTVAIDFTK